MLNPFSNHRGICVCFELVASSAALTSAAVVAMFAVAVCDCICEMLLLFTYIVEQSAIENNHVSVSYTLLHFRFFSGCSGWDGGRAER